MTAPVASPQGEQVLSAVSGGARSIEEEEGIYQPKGVGLWRNLQEKVAMTTRVYMNNEEEFEKLSKRTGECNPNI